MTTNGVGMSRSRIGLGLMGALVILVTAACGRDDRSSPEELEPLVTFETTTLRIETASDTFQITAELAETAEQRAYGLMERSSLPDDHGMLFTYAEPQAPDAGFWMYRTLIPLDIAFLDDEGRVIAFHAMEPCASPYPQVCRTYAPGAPYRSALEVARGYFQRRGVAIGDRIVPGGVDQGS
jgi:uncharacterized membrane protein (UPF0127 family)